MTEIPHWVFAIPLLVLAWLVFSSRKQRERDIEHVEDAINAIGNAGIKLGKSSGVDWLPMMIFASFWVAAFDFLWWYAYHLALNAAPWMAVYTGPKVLFYFTCCLVVQLFFLLFPPLGLSAIVPSVIGFMILTILP